MKNVYKKVGWRKHLVPNQREWITEYINTHGVDFYTRAIDLIKMAWKYNRKEIVLAKFIKTNICVVVQRKDYEIAMKYCMMWLEHKEEYEYCAIVRDYLNERKTKSKKLSFEEQIHSLIS